MSLIDVVGGGFAGQPLAAFDAAFMTILEIAGKRTCQAGAGSAVAIAGPVGSLQ